MKRRVAAVLPLVMVLAVAACSGPDDADVTPAPSAGDPACAALVARLPDTLLGRARVSGDVAGAATWGDPPIVLRCGVTPPGPSTQCLNVDGADWVFAEDGDAYRFVTYGRTPVVELSVPASVDRTQAPGALAQLSTAVSVLAVGKRCPEPGAGPASSG